MNFDLAGVITAIGSAGVGVYVKILKPYIRREKAKKAEYFRKLDEIHTELRFNGGSSIKDAIYRLDKTTQAINFELGEIKENQKVAMNLQGLAFWNSNDKGECIYASPGLCRILERSESDILGNSWVAWITEEDRERVFDAWEFSVKNRTPFDEVYHFRMPSGTIKKVWGLAFHKAINGVHLGTLGKLVETP